MHFFRWKRPSNDGATVTVGQSPREALAQTGEAQQRLMQRITDILAAPPAQNALSSESESEASQAHLPIFPWSIRRLRFPPPLGLSRINMSAPPTHSPSPFPRYGHSLPLAADLNGELYLFGGSVGKFLRSDLYVISTRDLSATVLHTNGDLPLPRVGHASVLVGRVLIIWGGDTNIQASLGRVQDNALYLLNITTSEWTKITTRDGPVGRYGHTMTMVGTKLFMFAGQVGGQFLDDLWAFDLQSLKSATPAWEKYQTTDGNAPCARTGHVCVTYNDRIYVFGGTDGNFRYNDTWSFDVATRTWEELECTGFIPSAREGHAAALIDDVMHIFGGRGVDGTNLNGLAALRISNKRWYTFLNMGPAPSVRSGHAMASSGKRVFVMGGEASGAAKQEDANIIYVLDTKHIKYPLIPSASQNGSQIDQKRSPAKSFIDSKFIQFEPVRHGSSFAPGSSGTNSTMDGINEIHPLDDTILDPDHVVGLSIAPPVQLHDTESHPNSMGLSDGEHNMISSRLINTELNAIPDLSKHIHNITGPLRSGGFCDIYVGELKRQEDAKQVAMKMLRVFSTEEYVVKAKKKFRREVDLWRSLRHPNVLTFYGTCEIEENRLFMVSPWAQGGNSLEYLRQNPTADRMKILQQTSSALEYLHSGKDIPQIVHGDLKADNVLISETGDALLSDFGLSRHVEDVMTMTATSSANNPGQIRFMAPELIKPPKNASHCSKPTPATDVFGFASLVLQVYTEKPPFSDLSEVQALFEIVSGVLPHRPTEAIVLERGLHDGIWTLMTDCWQFDAGKRPTMEEVVWRMTELVR